MTAVISVDQRAAVRSFAGEQADLSCGIASPISADVNHGKLSNEIGYVGASLT